MNFAPKHEFHSNFYLSKNKEIIKNLKSKEIPKDTMSQNNSKKRGFNQFNQSRKQEENQLFGE